LLRVEKRSQQPDYEVDYIYIVGLRQAQTTW
jgi:hypothetical protein